ncbi:hypothetical protein L1887_36771 [Cichorium endivia]|nr:hypothetical protein L1887_36771 [Cichorium endivia]
MFVMSYLCHCSSATRAAGRRYRRSPCQGIKILQRATRNQEVLLPITAYRLTGVVSFNHPQGSSIQSPIGKSPINQELAVGRLVQSPTEEFRLVGCRLRTLDFVIGYVIPDIEYTVHALIYLIDIFPASSKVEAPAFFLDDMQRSFSNGFDLKLKGFKTATVIGNKTVRYQTKSNYWLVTYEFD